MNVRSIRNSASAKREHESGVTLQFPASRRAARGRKAAAGIFAATALAGTLAACGSSSTSSASSSSTASSTATTNISIGDGIANIEILPIWVAQTEGYFAAHHLNVKLATLTDTTVTPALVSGSIQYAEVAVSLFESALSDKVPVIAIQNVAEGVPGALIVTKKYATAHSLTSSTPAATAISALKGSIGGFSSPVTQGQANLLLKSDGVSTSQVKEVSFSTVSGVEAAFEKGEIDWFVTGQPTPDLLASKGLGTVIADRQSASAWSAPLINEVLISESSYASAHSTVTKELAASLKEALSYINSNSAGAAAILQQNETGLPTAVAKEALSASIWPASSPFSAQQWASSLKFAIACGEVPAGSSIPASAYTNSYLAG